MIKTANRLICSLISLFLIIQLSDAQFNYNKQLDRKFNESIFLILDYSRFQFNGTGNPDIYLQLQAGMDGFVMDLTLDKISNKIKLINPDRSLSEFSDILKSILQYLEADSANMVCLFLYPEFDTDKLPDGFKKAGLGEFLYNYDLNSEWPTLQSMIEHNNRLIVFLMNHQANFPQGFNSFDDLVFKTQSSASGDLQINDINLENNLQKDLVFFSGFLTKYRQTEADQDIYQMNEPYMIDLFLKTWKSIGKVPNFIVYDQVPGFYSLIKSKLTDFDIVRGSVTFNSEPLQTVHWKGSNSITGGKFFFPILLGDQLKLTPEFPGYKFKPAAITIDNIDDQQLIHFKAKTLSILRNLELYFPLDGNIKDMTPKKHHGNGNNILFNNDTERGMVMQMEEESIIGMDRAEALKINDHDFTVSVWLKIPKYLTGKSDYCILGSKSYSYLRGMHLLIRNKKPFMGFFNNDLAGNTVIEENKWYHIVWRYDKTIGEQAIFVNGRLDTRALNRPAYMGVDSIYIGLSGFNEFAFFSGELDDLCIWSRPLGNAEISGLFKKNISLPSKYNFFWRYPIEIDIIVLLLIGTAFSFYYIKRKARSQKKIVHNTVISDTKANIVSDEKITYKNYIGLFGDFKVYDREGIEISNLFTPKIKQLFVALLLHSTDNKPGLTSREISGMLWKGQSYQDTKNTRAVTFRHLRILLGKLDQVELKLDKRWLVKLTGNARCDYYDFQRLTEGNLKRSKDVDWQLWSIISKGELFKDESFIWLDDFKNAAGSYIIDFLVNFLDTLSIGKDNDMIMRVSDHIFIYDNTNDTALSCKIRTMVDQNMLNQARFTYDRFCTLFEEMYGEKYPVAFNDILKELQRR